MIEPKFDTCPICVKTIEHFVRRIGLLTCPHCKAALKFTVVPPHGHYGRSCRSEHGDNQTSMPMILEPKVHVIPSAQEQESACWTTEAMHLEMERRLAEDLALLGPRPSWWRRRAQRRHDREALRLKKAHAQDLRTMLATQDSKYRAIMANLIGWKLPTEKRQEIP